MLRVALLMLTCVLTACTGNPAPKVSCGATPGDEGLAAFANSTGTRDGPRDLRLRFTLTTSVNERYTSTPTIETNLGEVLDAQAEVGVLVVQVLLGNSGAVNGRIKLTGTISGDFNEDLDRCPYERSFSVNQDDASAPVNVAPDGT